MPRAASGKSGRCTTSTISPSRLMALQRSKWVTNCHIHRFRGESGAASFQSVAVSHAAQGPQMLVLVPEWVRRAEGGHGDNWWQIHLSHTPCHMCSDCLIDHLDTRTTGRSMCWSIWPIRKPNPYTVIRAWSLWYTTGFWWSSFNSSPMSYAATCSSVRMF